MPGTCRRYPPTPIPGGARWANTDAGDWCGEHSAFSAKKVDAPKGPAGDKPAVKAVPSTGGADPDGDKKPADAGPPPSLHTGAFALPPRGT